MPHLFLYTIQVEVGHVREIDEIFDAISYKKGAAIIRMLQTYLGADKFQVILAGSVPLVFSLVGHVSAANIGFVVYLLVMVIEWECLFDFQ